MTTTPPPSRPVDADVTEPVADDAATQPVASQAPDVQPWPTADKVAMWAAIVIPVLGVLGGFVGLTWLTVAFLMLAPIIAIVYGVTLFVLVRVLRRRSVLRDALGGVPRRYLVYAWAWALTYPIAAFAPTVGGSDGPGLVQAGVVGGAAIVAGVLTGAIWSRYLGDKAWIERPRED